MVRQCHWPWPPDSRASLLGLVRHTGISSPAQSGTFVRGRLGEDPNAGEHKRDRVWRIGAHHLPLADLNGLAGEQGVGSGDASKEVCKQTSTRTHRFVTVCGSVRRDRDSGTDSRLVPRRHDVRHLAECNRRRGEGDDDGRRSKRIGWPIRTGH